MPFTLPDLPYAPDAFGDILSAETFDYHHGKHHKAYVTKANALVAEKPQLQGKTLLELIAATKDGAAPGLFNQVGQIWNHSFYWQSLSPNAPEPSGALAEKIEAFGGREALAKQLVDHGTSHFASGWVALILNGDSLAVTSYHDADTPVARGHKPLLIIDLWEHAHYIDYRNARPEYLETVVNDALNWEFAALNLDGEGASRADQPG